MGGGASLGKMVVCACLSNPIRGLLVRVEGAADDGLAELAATAGYPRSTTTPPPT